MQHSIFALNGVVSNVVGTAIFVLLWVFIFKSIKSACFFKNKAMELMVTTCVSLLAYIAMFRSFGTGVGTHSVTGKTGSTNPIIEMILLPYAVLGITIVLVALILLVNKLLGKDKSKKFLSDADRREATFGLNAGKVDNPGNDNLEKVNHESKMARDKTRSPKPIDRPSEEQLHQSDIRKETSKLTANTS